MSPVVTDRTPRRTFRTLIVLVLAFAGGASVAVVAGGTPVPISVTATVDQGYTGAVARFDAVTCGPCTSTIDWGDGVAAPSTSPGTIASTGPGDHTVTGAHTYTRTGAYTITVTNVAGAQTETATSPATVVTVPPPATTTTERPPPLPTPPTASFAVTPGTPLSNQPATLDGTASTGTSLTYRWTICDAPGDAHAACSNGAKETGATVTHAFPLAAAHDLPRVRKGKPGARRATYQVILAVTDSAGQTASTSRLVTVMPNGAPIPGFTHDVTSLLINEPGLFSTLARDPDQQDQIVEERWDVSGDGVDDLSCLPFGFCTLTPQAGGLTKPKPPEPKDDTAPAGPPTVKLKPPPAVELEEVAPNPGGPIEIGVNPGYEAAQYGSVAETGLTLQPTSTKQTAGKRRSSSRAIQGPSAGNQGAGLKPGSLPKQSLPSIAVQQHPKASGPKERFPSFAFDFYGLRLAQVGLAPFDELDFASAKAGQSTQVANTQSALFAYAKKVQDLAQPQFAQGDDEGVLFPWQVRQTVRDSTGATASATLPISFKANLHPKAEGVYLQKDSDKPLVTGTQVRVVRSPTDSLGFPADPAQPLDRFNIAGTSDKEGPIRWYAFGVRRQEKPYSNQETFYRAVGKDPKQFGFTFSKPGYYRIAMTVYDGIGLGSSVVVKGLRVEDATADCATISGEKIGMVGMSGDCVKIADNRKLFVATGPLTVNGLTLAPVTGAIVVDNSGKTPEMFSTTKPVPPLADLNDASKRKAFLSAAKPLPAKVGIAEAKVRLGEVGSLADVATGILSLNTGISVPVAAGAQYNALPVAPGSLAVDMGSGGSSKARFKLLMPSALQSVTSEELSLAGLTKLKESKVETIHKTGVGDAMAAKLRRIAPAPKPVARTAAGSPNFQLPNDVYLGPIKIPGGPDGVTFSYDDAAGTWTAKIELEIPGLPAAATATIVMKGSSIVSFSGNVPTAIPIAPGVILDKVFFSVVPDPADPAITGGVGVTVAELLDGEGQLTVHPTQPRVRFDGNVKLLGLIPLGGGYVDWGPAPGGQKAIAFGGHVGYDFGPASFNASVNGAMTTSGPFHFFVEGSGEACLFACLDTHTMISDIGVAACGEIDLFFDSISAGLGYRRQGGLDVWVGSCDLESYRPAGLRAVTGDGAEPRAVVALNPGQSMPVQVRGDEGTLVLAVHGQPGAQDGPHVTLTGPAGDKRVITTAATPGDYAFSGEAGLAPASLKPTNAKATTSLVEINPISATTTLMVPKPAKGTWTLSVDPGSLPVTGLDFAQQLPDIPKNAVAADVSTKVAKGATISTGSAFAAAKRSLGSVPAFERSRLRTMKFTVQKGAGKVTLIDNGPTSSRILTQTSASGSLAFDPAADPGKHTIKAVFLHPNGLPRDTRVVGAYTAPPPPKPATPDIARATRKGSVATIVLDRAPRAPDAHAIALEVFGTGARGTRVAAAYDLGDVRRQGGKWAIQVKGLAAKGDLKLKVVGLYGNDRSKAVTVKVKTL